MVDGNAIRLKSQISHDVRTPGKDECAAWIWEHLVQSGKSMSKTRAAEGSGWSRQHVSNVLRDYFEEGESRDELIDDRLQQHLGQADHGPTDDVGHDELHDMNGDETVEMTIERLVELVNDEYRKGYQDGFSDNTQSV